ncbi:putative proline-specific permease [Lachnellula occidentalis]|uniref:Putative proline-specific permease n=1 Tax=Lachnellula occidentalis TaxID=215460 RepID=A0A8H8UJE3_9HELO|nr:putative proline-specific permease [Lachnellula occidentalis]
MGEKTASVDVDIEESPATIAPIHGHVFQKDVQYAELSEEAQQRYGKTARGLTNRHMQLITIGSSIGSGMFVGIGSALARSGPLSVFLGFTFFSVFILWPLFMAAAEMCSWLPVRGSIFQFAERYVDPALGFAGGYVYWYGALMLVISDFTGVVSVISYWDDKTNKGWYILLTLGLSLLLNLVAVKFYGEVEFVTASFKIILVLSLIAATFVTMLGGNPQHDRYGFRYWHHPMKEYLEKGSLGCFLGFWRIFIYAAFACGGPDVVMMTSAEVQNPRVVIPRATRKIYFRLGLFYIVGTLALGIICPDDDPTLLKSLDTGASGSAASPWVIGLRNHGINGLANLVNAIVLTSAWSCGNAYVYSSSRTLYGLAVNGKAPAIFKKCLGNGVPVYALAAVAAVSCLSFLNATSSTNVVLGWFINLCSVSFMITYMIILYTHIRFRAAVTEQIGVESLYFRTPFGLQPYASYFSLAFAFIIVIFNGFWIFWPGAFSASDFISSYFGVFFFIVLFVAYKLYMKTSFVKAEEADIFSGKQAIDDEEEAFVQSRVGKHVPLYERAFDKLF